MKNAKNDNQNLIERFFLEKLSAEELFVFNHKIQEDPDFAMEVNIYRAIHSSNSIPSAKEMATYHRSSSLMGTRRKMLLFVVTVICISIISILFYYLFHIPNETQNAPPDSPVASVVAMESDSLINNFYTIPNNLISALKNLPSISLNRVLSPGLEAFAQDSFKQVVHLFNTIDPRSHPKEYEISQEYLAHAYFNEKNFTKAAEIFKRIEIEGNKTNAVTSRQRAQWYLLLSLLSQDNDSVIHQQEVNRLFERINNQQSTHNYYALGRALKTQLKRSEK